MKRGPNKHTRAFRALMAAKKENRKLTIDEATLIQDSNYSRFGLPNGASGDAKLLTPEELIEHEYKQLQKYHYDQSSIV